MQHAALVGNTKRRVNNKYQLVYKQKNRSLNERERFFYSEMIFAIGSYVQKIGLVIRLQKYSLLPTLKYVH